MIAFIILTSQPFQPPPCCAISGESWTSFPLAVTFCWEACFSFQPSGILAFTFYHYTALATFTSLSSLSFWDSTLSFLFILFPGSYRHFSIMPVIHLLELFSWQGISHLSFNMPFKHSFHMYSTSPEAHQIINKKHLPSGILSPPTDSPPQNTPLKLQNCSMLYQTFCHIEWKSGFK